MDNMIQMLEGLGRLRGHVAGAGRMTNKPARGIGEVAEVAPAVPAAAATPSVAGTSAIVTGVVIIGAVYWLLARSD